jgi:anaerobic selenocysteine-containing dehydrogenase
MLTLLLRVMRQKGFKSLLKYQHGLKREDHKNDFLTSRIVSESKKVNLAPDIMINQKSRVEDHFEQERTNTAQLKLITKRAVTTHNSWTHNFEGFVGGENFTNYLYIHPKDAYERGIENKQLVDVTSAAGQVRVQVKFLNDLQRGTVALPHGWGHQSSLLSVAKKTKGVNVNILAADGPDKIDPISGMANLTGIYVEVKPAAGKRAENSWSGLEKDALNISNG